jgi:hypothetical protein
VNAVLERTVDQVAEASVNAVIAALHAMTGRFEDARRLVTNACLVYEDRGAVLALEMGLSPLSMEIERLAGDLDAAAETGRRSLDVLLGHGGSAAHAATRAAQLAEVEIARGDVQEAERLLGIARANTVEYDVLTQFLTCAMQARVSAHHGRHERAQADAAEAVRLGEATDAIVDRARTLIALEEVLWLGGKHDAARGAAEEAERLLAAKGSSAGITRFRERLKAVSPA